MQRFSQQFDVGTGLQGLVSDCTRGFQVPCHIKQHFLPEHTVYIITILLFPDNFQKMHILVQEIDKQLICYCPQNISQNWKKDFWKDGNRGE